MKLSQLIHDLLGLAFRAGYHQAQRRHCPPRLCYRVGLVTDKPSTKDKAMPLEIALTTEQQVRVTLDPVMPKGKPVPVPVDGVPTWAIVSGEATLDPAPDGLSCMIVSPDSAGQSQVLVSADADLGAGVNTITDTISVLASDPQAASLGLTVGTPENKP